MLPGRHHDSGQQPGPPPHKIVPTVIKTAEVPGCTRGLDILGNLAFVGLSQVRESAVFSGIPIAERALAERNCGVWVVDLRTGQTVAFLRFEDAVQEVFAVQVLPGLRYPELAPDDLVHRQALILG